MPLGSWAPNDHDTVSAVVHGRWTIDVIEGEDVSSAKEIAGVFEPQPWLVRRIHPLDVVDVIGSALPGEGAIVAVAH